jgi:hypothetical protein
VASEIHLLDRPTRAIDLDPVVTNALGNVTVKACANKLRAELEGIAVQGERMLILISHRSDNSWQTRARDRQRATLSVRSPVENAPSLWLYRHNECGGGDRGSSPTGRHTENRWRVLNRG